MQAPMQEGQFPFPVKYGYCAVGRVEAGPEAWRGLCTVLGPNTWAEDPDLATPEGRNRQAVLIETALAAWALRLEPTVAASRLQAQGVPAGPVQPTDALGYDLQLVEGGFWTEMNRRYVGRHLTPSAPFAYDGRRPALLRPAPTLGEHTAEVLAELGTT